MNPRRRRAPRLPLLAAVALAVAALAGTAVPAPVAAACGTVVPPADALSRASTVFVGTVASVTDGGYTASFDVEEIWKGPNLADPITVYGGSADAEGSRSWQAGQRYLVFPGIDPQGNLTDTSCSPTAVYQTSFDALRPSDARPPQGPPTSGLPGDPPYAAVFLVIIVFGTLGAFFFWRTGRVRTEP